VGQASVSPVRTTHWRTFTVCAEVGHRHHVRAGVEVVEHARRRERVPDRPRLFEAVLRDRLRVPDPPLVDDGADAPGGDERLQYRRGPVDVPPDGCRPGERPEVLRLGEVGRLARLVVAVDREVVEEFEPTDIGDGAALAERLEEPPVPVGVVVATGDEFEAPLAEHPLERPEVVREPAELERVALGVVPAATAPVLVADTPPAHVLWLLAAVLAAHLDEVGAPVVVAVLRPVDGFARRPAPDVPREVGLRADAPADPQELLGAEPVGFHPLVFPALGPPEAPTSGTRLSRADAVSPVVVVGETPPWPPEHRRVEVREEGEGSSRTPSSVGTRSSSPIQSPP